MIAQYQAQDKEKELSSARLYALSQSHKHIKEMKAISGLERTPLFSPMVTDYYSGMTLQKQTLDSPLAVYRLPSAHMQW